MKRNTTTSLSTFATGISEHILCITRVKEEIGVLVIRTEGKKSYKKNHSPKKKIPKKSRKEGEEHFLHQRQHQAR